MSEWSLYFKSKFTIVENGKLNNKAFNSSHASETNYNLVAIAASAGGLQAVSEVLSHLPEDFPASIIVLQHLSPDYKSLMAKILARRTPLQVKSAEEGEKLCPGTVYVAPPRYHLEVKADLTLTLTEAEKVNFVRPSADVLLKSIAKSHRQRAIAVILTGKGKDGTAGVEAMHATQGKIIAQNYGTAEHSGMPHSAIDTGIVDIIVPLEEIAERLIELVMSK